MTLREKLVLHGEMLVFYVLVDNCTGATQVLAIRLHNSAGNQRVKLWVRRVSVIERSAPWCIADVSLSCRQLSAVSMKWQLR